MFSGRAIALLLAGMPLLAATPGPQSFDDSHFTFAFQYDPGWIPVTQPEGETVTFSLSEGEVYVSAGRDPNPHRLKTRQELADEHIQTWKNRLDFSSISRKDTTLNGVPATLVSGNAKLFDNDQPYRLEIYVLEHDGKLYVVKFSGLYDPSVPYWDGFQRLLKNFRFRDPSLAPRNTPSPTPYVPIPTPTPAGKGPDSSWSDKGD